MNRTSLAVVVAALATLLPCPSALAQGKVGVINLTKVFDDFWRTKQADVQIKDRLAEFEKMGQSMYDDYKKANEEFGKQIEAANDPALSKEETEKRRKDLDKKRKDILEMENNIKQFQGNSQRAILDQQKRMRDSVLRDIRGVVEEKAKAGGYQAVIDTAATSLNQTPIVVYTSLVGSTDDLSDAVLKALNANAPAEGAEKKEDKKDDKKASP